MIEVALCDDMPEHLERSRELVGKYLVSEGEEPSFSLFSSADGLKAAIRNGYIPELAVLDIEMPGEDGISLARELNRIAENCRIIFLTSYLDYAQDAYEAEHIWFTVKKDAEKYLPSAIGKALSSIRDDSADKRSVIIKNRGQKQILDINDIYYITKAGRKSLCHCISGDYYDTRRPALLIPPTLEEKFIRCHQGYWVNADKISRLDKDEFILSNSTRIPISRSFRDSARKAFFKRYGIDR